jgi:hypothetical protein
MRRKAGLFVICALLLPLAATANAWGQGATIRVSDQTPAPGQVVQLTGTGFSNVVPVSIRFDSRTGTERASGTATSAGVLQPNPIQLVIPANLSPGWHLILATQTLETNNAGRPAAFTPGRTRINVGGVSAGTSAPPVNGSPPDGRGGLPDSPLGLLALGAAFLLLATGATLTARKIRALNRPQLGR